MALTQGGAARPRPHPVHDHAGPAGCSGRAGRAGDQLFLRGGAGYFRYGNSARAFDKIRGYALLRVALFIAKRHQRGRARDFARAYRSGNELGLISLNGIVVAPRPNRAWRAPVERRR
jgi:hypothetical protein